MNILEYKVGFNGAFFGCINRNVQISWDTSSVKKCKLYWIDSEENKHFLGDTPNRYTLPLLKRRTKVLNNSFDDLAGTILYEFEPLNTKKGIFFNTPHFYNDNTDVKWISKGSIDGWFIFEKGEAAYWKDPKWYEEETISSLQSREWFSEVLGITFPQSFKDNYLIWIQDKEPVCVEVSDPYGLPPLGWFSKDHRLESWSCSKDEKRLMACIGKPLSTHLLPSFAQEQFGLWKIHSFLSSKKNVDLFKGTQKGNSTDLLYGLLIANDVDSNKKRFPCFFEDWLGRRFRCITKEKGIYFSQYHKNKGWETFNKTEKNYDESYILEDQKGFFWSLVASEDKTIFESYSEDSGKTWSNYQMIIKGACFPLLIMGQKGKRIRAVLKDNRLLFSIGGSKKWWTACTSQEELKVKEDRFSIIASKDIKESWYLFVCLEDEDEPSEWISLDECKTWSCLS